MRLTLGGTESRFTGNQVAWFHHAFSIKTKKTKSRGQTAALTNLVFKILYATEDEKNIAMKQNISKVSPETEAQKEATEMINEEEAIKGEGEYVEGYYMLIHFIISFHSSNANCF